MGTEVGMVWATVEVMGWDMEAMEAMGEVDMGECELCFLLLLSILFHDEDWELVWLSELLVTFLSPF